MQSVSFDEIAGVFIERVHMIVWCSVATVDTQGRPRSRILHPIWEVVDGRPMGWIATGRHTLKTKHLARQPHVSLAYIGDVFKPVYVDCRAEWADDPETKRRISEWFGSVPPPLGYDTKLFFGPVDNPAYGVLKLTPWRVVIETAMEETKVWRAYR